MQKLGEFTAKGETVVVNPSNFARTKHVVSINLPPIWRPTTIANGDSVVPEVNIGQRLYILYLQPGYQNSGLCIMYIGMYKEDYSSIRWRRHAESK